MHGQQDIKKKEQTPYIRDAKIPGARLPGRLNFLLWCPQYSWVLCMELVTYHPCGT